MLSAATIDTSLPYLVTILFTLILTLVFNEYTEEAKVALEFKGASIEVASSRTEIPFYLYDLDTTGLDWVSQCGPKLSHSNHNDEVFMYQQMVEHPWRTRNVSKALLFVVPAFLGNSIRHKCGNHSDNMSKLKAFLNSQPQFVNSRGMDHLIVASDNKIRNNGKHNGLFNSLNSNIILGSFETHYKIQKTTLHHHDSYCAVVTPYTTAMTLDLSPSVIKPMTSKQAPHTTVDWLDESLESFQQDRPYDFFFVGQIDTRPAYKTRAVVFKNFPIGNNVLVNSSPDGAASLKQPACNGSVNKCFEKFEASKFHLLLRQSKFNLMIHGDTSTSARLYDALLAGTINVVISDNIRLDGLPFQCIVNWKRLIIQISQSQLQRHPVTTINKLIKQTQDVALLRSIRQEMRTAHKQLLWGVANSMVGHNMLRQALRKCGGNFPRQKRRAVKQALEADPCLYGPDVSYTH